jgi:tripartite-type tricarboxylate transporter receptor subunit TctC
MMKRRHLLASTAAVATGLVAAPRIASAQAFPDRPLRFVVPYAAGGSSDTSARIAAERLTSILGQQVVVENKAGGGTIIGTEFVAHAKPDGYTFLLSPAAAIANAAFGTKTPYDIQKDFVPVVSFVELPMLLAANNDTPYKTMAELIAWSKANPSKPLPYASSGVGALSHLWGEYIKARTGMPLEHVGYRGSADAIKDVIAGHVPLFSDVLVPTATAIRAGKLRGLVVATTKRTELLPDVPTVGEAGLAGMEGVVPFGITVPAGTPREVIQRLNAAFNEAMKDPATAKRLGELGFTVVGGAPEVYSTLLATEIPKWQKVIKDSNIPPPS